MLLVDGGSLLQVRFVEIIHRFDEIAAAIARQSQLFCPMLVLPEYDTSEVRSRRCSIRVVGSAAHEV